MSPSFTPDVINLSVSVTVDKIAESSALIIAVAVLSIVVGFAEDALVVKEVCNNVGAVAI